MTVCYYREDQVDKFKISKFIGETQGANLSHILLLTYKPVNLATSYNPVT